MSTTKTNAKSKSALTDVDPVKKQALAVHADAIRCLGKRVIGDIVEIGKRLSECKDIAGHGNWLPWLEREFGWKERTAQRFMHVARVFGAVNPSGLTDLDLPAEALYLLSAPSTPKEVRDPIVERAEKGEKLTTDQVKAAVKAADLVQKNNALASSELGLPGLQDAKTNGTAAPRTINVDVRTVTTPPRTINVKMSTVTTPPRTVTVRSSTESVPLVTPEVAASLNAQIEKAAADTDTALSAGDLGNEIHRLEMKKIALNSDISTLEDAIEAKKAKLDTPADVKEPIPLEVAIEALIYWSLHCVFENKLPEDAVYRSVDLQDVALRLRRLDKFMAKRRKAIAGRRKAK